MNDARKPRETETRVAVQRPKQWQPAELLPEPDKKPGWAYRWVRTATLNTADPRNISKSLREGWEPESIEEQPSMQLLTDPNSRFKDNIEIGGLLLCKCPMELVEQRNAHFHNMTRAQTESVDNNLMRQSDPRMPLFQEKRSTSSFGKGA
jgi:hypothetical protein